MDVIKKKKPTPKAIRSFERDPASLRRADVFALKPASVYADALYVRKTTKDLQRVLWRGMSWSTQLCNCAAAGNEKIGHKQCSLQMQPATYNFHSMCSIYIYVGSLCSAVGAPVQLLGGLTRSQIKASFSN